MANGMEEAKQGKERKTNTNDIRHRNLKPRPTVTIFQRWKRPGRIENASQRVADKRARSVCIYFNGITLSTIAQCPAWH